jgi:hypothetical protein
VFRSDAKNYPEVFAIMEPQDRLRNVLSEGQEETTPHSDQRMTNSASSDCFVVFAAITCSVNIFSFPNSSSPPKAG